MSDLHFDSFQFASRRHPVAAKYTQDGWTSNGLAFEDYTRCQARTSSVPLRAKRWTPKFAASDEQLRKVLMRKAWTYLHNDSALPQGAIDWKAVNIAATAKALKQVPAFYRNCPTHKRGESEAHVAAVRRAGGYLELQAAIAYRAWRLGQDSVAVGESLGMSPQSVRVNLQRMCEIARALGFETFQRHPSKGRCRNKQARE
jgi:hypothetical protein